MPRVFLPPGNRRGGVLFILGGVSDCAISERRRQRQRAAKQQDNKQADDAHSQRSNKLQGEGELWVEIIRIQNKN